ncbi:ribonuclease III [Pediococcus siamensis]|uniref:ribonuclease III n=1 Tax=Pediococcus siamensis TaxID=381829 RepID=UPI0039A2D0A5
MKKWIDAELKKNFQIEFHNENLLNEALTQASYVNEHPNRGLKFYERIEFLGDAVLQLIVSEYIFKRYPEMPQGKLTRLRAAMVCEASFSQFARECHLDRYILLGKGEEKAGARNRDSLLCDIFESFVGALYLDQGRDAVERFVHQVIFPKLDTGAFDHVIDFKTNLQEFLQRDGDADIRYELLNDAGPESDLEFEVAVLSNEQRLGTGAGKSKKIAEQNAAREALHKLRVKND